MARSVALLVVALAALAQAAESSDNANQKTLGAAAAAAASSAAAIAGGGGGGGGVVGGILPLPLPVPVPFPVSLPYPSLLPFNPFRPFQRPFTLPVPGRPGLCPFVNRLVPQGHPHSASVCGNTCHNDRVCPLGQKCCPTECGYSCFHAVIPAHY